MFASLLAIMHSCALCFADTTNDLSEDEAVVITENTDLMRQYINDGGSVMSHAGGFVYGECVVRCSCVDVLSLVVE